MFRSGDVALTQQRGGIVDGVGFSEQALGLVESQGAEMVHDLTADPQGQQPIRLAENAHRFTPPRRRSQFGRDRRLFRRFQPFGQLLQTIGQFG